MSAPIQWAQRKDSVYMTVRCHGVFAQSSPIGRALAHPPLLFLSHLQIILPDVKDAKIELSDAKLIFSGTSNGKVYKADLELFADLDSAAEVSCGCGPRLWCPCAQCVMAGLGPPRAPAVGLVAADLWAQAILQPRWGPLPLRAPRACGARDATRGTLIPHAPRPRPAPLPNPAGEQVRGEAPQHPVSHCEEGGGRVVAPAAEGQVQGEEPGVRGLQPLR